MNNADRTALVLGATGLVGRHCVQALLDSGAYRDVRLLTRRPTGLADARLRDIRDDLENMAAHAADFQVDDLFCCLGTTLKTAGSREAFSHVDYELVVEAGRLGRAAGAGQMLVVSALNARARSPFFYARVKGEMEAALEAQQWPRLIFCQPSLLRGDRQEHRPGEEWGNRLFALADPLVRWSKADWLPVEASLVGRAMVGMALYRQGDGVFRARYQDFLQFAGMLSVSH
ncbi:hypothetical protein A11A3_15452 [Alcanivorax hongdengensis A-11-3]|uniref:NAD(P)-binding domain-containing protein n=1 Tax=Alcanivorax hongdengensis A-11-3 TaxID=1177179 RepID=L0W7X8_9GAMM|nr:NAD(P)H-binding protein [Alcanivorax hongdengensis]EKF73069.1 hypothetical protein A11A3_15452 [Alcanivorax hongdengensis A-11-3]